MKKIIMVVLPFLIISLFNACPPHLTRRYHSITIEPIQDNNDLVKIATFTIDIPSSAKKSSLMQLSPEGQAAFINGVVRETYSVETFLKFLGANIGNPKESGDIIDLTVFKKRVVFSVEKQTFEKSNIRLADRIDQLLIKMSNLKGAKFLSWDKFETKYETVDIGKITNTQGYNLGLEVPFKKPDVNVSLGVNQNLYEEVMLRQRYVELSGLLEEKNASLYQQGVTGIDLAGNFSVDFKIKADSDESKLHPILLLKNLGKHSKPNDAKDIQISFLKIKYPTSSKPIICDLEYLYSLRHVEKNGDTLIEGDDVVKFIRSRNNAKPIELVGAEELRVRVFYIVTNKDVKSNSYSKNGYRLHLKRFNKIVICFSDYQNAKNFLDWLKISKNLTISGYDIWLTHRSMEKEDISSLYIQGKNLN
jgi:hypothetical protein